MRRLPILLALAALCLTAAPAGAAAEPGCLYEDRQLTAKNRGNIERALLCLTNVHRARQGLEPLLWDTRLARAARSHTEDMYDRRYFDHTSPPPEARGPSERAEAAGYPTAGSQVGEIIGYSVTGTAQNMFWEWRLDPSAGPLLRDPALATTGAGVGECWQCASGGISGTQMLSYQPANTAFDGLDLYVAEPRRCLSGRVAERAAARAVARLERAVAVAPAGRRRSALRAKLRRARARLEAARSQTTTACAGQSP